MLEHVRPAGGQHCGNPKAGVLDLLCSRVTVELSRGCIGQSDGVSDAPPQQRMRSTRLVNAMESCRQQNESKTCNDIVGLRELLCNYVAVVHGGFENMRTRGWGYSGQGDVVKPGV
jgi:hypothetical protein